MRVSRGKASVISDVTVNQDIDFLTTYQVKRLASPASGEALRKGNKDITNAEIADAAAIAISKLASNPFPSGVIALWHGAIGSIPSGFLICDGNNSTPNLLTKFVQGVATSGTAPGSTGGAATHVLTDAELSSHEHASAGYPANPYRSSGTMVNETHVTHGTVDNVQTTSGTIGSDSAHENEPTFYDVAFIMKT